MKEYEAHRKSEDALRRCLDCLYKENDTDAAVDNLLSIVAKFYGADRTYMYEIDPDTDSFKCTYEWHHNNVSPAFFSVDGLASDVIKNIVNLYAAEGEVWIASTEDEIAPDDPLYNTFMFQQIESVFISPIRDGKILKAFLGIDNPKKSMEDRFLVRSVSILLYSEVQRRRALRLKEREAEKQKRQLELDKSIIDVLASDYSSAFYVDLDADTFTPLRMDETMDIRFGDIHGNNIAYSPAYRIFVNTVVHDDDKEEMFTAGSVENIKEVLKNDSVAFKRFRCFIGGFEEIFEAKYVKIGPVDSKPQYVVIGIANREKETREETERQIELVEANRRAEEANKAKTTFLFNMSHDIRTPMNAIIGYTDMAIESSSAEKKKDYLSKVKIASNQLLGLVNDILDMARIENGKITIEESPNDIIICANNSFQVLKQGSKDRGLNMYVEYRNIEHNRVYCDELRLNRIFTNIISNSVKYTKPGGEIHFIVEEMSEKRPDYARFKFTITDTGIGMSEDFVGHIFDSFARERSSTVSGIEGAGLGMAITKELVDMMGGVIEIQSELGTGTIVSMRIDFRIAEDEPLKESDVEIINEAALEYKRVLLVEDNEMNREIAKNILESRGLIVEEANDGSVAVEMVLQKEPDYYDYVLMDVQMPYMDGYKATNTIRSFADARFSKLPIIAMTANAFEEDKKKALMAGMDAHLAKPINIKELFRTLQRFTE